MRSLKLREMCRPLVDILIPGIAISGFTLISLGVLPLPEFVRASALARFENPVALLVVGFLLFGVYRLSGVKGNVAASSLTLAIPALTLAAVWQAAESDGILVIGGLLPWSDASGYYGGAQLLSGGAELTEWHGRRPWFICLLGLLLKTTQGNLQWSIALLGIITAFGFFLFARTVAASLGAAAAAIALLVLFVFYGKYVATVMTEHLGLALGAISLAALWRGALQPRLGCYWAVGLWLLTCAMAARPGALLVLPALVAWGAWHSYRTVSAAHALRVLAMASLAIMGGIALDLLLRKAVSPGAVPAGNFSYVLYGLVAGNKGWTQVLRDYPQIKLLDDADAARAIYRLAFETFRANPMNAIDGALGTWGQFVSLRWLGVMGFVSAPYRIVPYSLAVLGVVHCLRRWRKAPYSMVLTMTGGVLASVPFAPPIDSQLMRAYAATIPLTALLVAIGSTIFLRPATNMRRETANQHSLIGYGALLILFTFGGAMLLRYVIPSWSFEPSVCPSGQHRLQVRVTEGSYLHLIADTESTGSQVPHVRVGEFGKHARRFRLFYKGLYPLLEMLQPGNVLRFSINWEPGRQGEQIWLVSDASALSGTSTVQVCGSLISVIEGIGFYRAETVKSVSP